MMVCQSQLKQMRRNGGRLSRRREEPLGSGLLLALENAQDGFGETTAGLRSPPSRMSANKGWQKTLRTLVDPSASPICSQPSEPTPAQVAARVALMSTGE